MVKMINPKYAAYLLSDEWKAKREKVLKRDKYRCKICKSTKKLNVHHKTYKRIYNERLRDLVTLCQEPCHRRIHERYNTKEKIQLFIAITSFYVVLISTVVIIFERFGG